jgi:deoxyribodipyrimidine photolyase-like uncharacterized protein
MTAVTLIFPHQLFANHPCIVRGQDVYLIEECLFFKQYRFHQQKLVLHRVSMKKYAELLDQLNVKVTVSAIIFRSTRTIETGVAREPRKVQTSKFNGRTYLLNRALSDERRGVRA